MRFHHLVCDLLIFQPIRHANNVPNITVYEYGECQPEARKKGQLKDWDPLTECEQHLLREVPLRLRQALSRHAETGLEILEEDLRRKATACVEQIIGQVFQELRLPELNTIATSPTDGPANLDQPGHFELNIDQFLDPDPFALLGDEELCFDQGGLLNNLLQPHNNSDNAMRFSDSGYESGSLEMPKSG
jgi:hypothetical protein